MVKTCIDPNQMPLIIPESSWRPPTSLPDNLLNYPYIALDTETNDPDLLTKGPSWFRGGGNIAGISMAWPGGKIYLPVGHLGGDNMDKTQVIGWLKDLLRNFKGTLIFMNCMYDLGWLRSEGVPVPSECKIWDVMMVEALLDEHKQRYNLDSILKTYTLPPKDERLLREAAAAYSLDAKSDLAKLPARFVGAYAEGDVVPLIDVYKRQFVEVQRQGIEKVVELEHDLIPMLLEMRFRGVRVNTSKAEQQAEEFDKEYDQIRQQIYCLTGHTPDVWAAESCAAAMDAAGIPFRKTSTGKPSFTDDWLSKHEHAVPKLITLARKAHKAGNTFCRGMILSHADKNGRVHGELHPLRSDDGGTVSGRFSMSNPNLQQVPVRDIRMNNLIRGLFLPEDGEQWCAADYSQQEPRLTIHYAFQRGCRGADIAARRYNENPDTDYHNMVAEMCFGAGFTPDQRKKAKTINLGLAYGMGGAKLARSLGLPTILKTNKYSGKEYEAAGPDAQLLLDTYHNKVPFIRELGRHYTDIAEEKGEIRTLSSRLCRFPYYEPKAGGRAMLKAQAIIAYGEGNIKRSFGYTALNRKIQGGSADMIKIAMRNLWREKIIPFVSIHDELGFSSPDQKLAKQVVEIMKSCVKLNVPLKVDVDMGPTWGLAKPMVEEEE